MKKITYFHLNSCPYCKNANKAIEELRAENPEYIEKYDYHAVPCMWIGDQKIYEAHLFEKYDECKEQVRKVFEAAK